MPPPQYMSTPVAPRVAPAAPNFEKVMARIRPRVQQLYRILQQAGLITGLTLNAHYPNRLVLTEVEMGKLLQKAVSEGKSIKGSYVKGWDDVTVFLAGTPAVSAYTGELIRRAVKKLNPQLKVQLPKKHLKRIFPQRQPRPPPSPPQPRANPNIIRNPNRSVGQLYESFYET